MKEITLLGEEAAFVELQAAASTRRMYRSDLGDLARFVKLRGRNLADATREDLVAWIQALEGREIRGKRGLDPATLARKLSVIRSFFEFLRGKGTLQRNPSDDLRPPKVDRSVGNSTCLAKREVEELLGVMDSSTPRGLRDRTIGLLLFGQGLRVSEVAGLERRSIASEDGYTVLRLSGKGGAAIRSVLSPEVEAVFREHLSRNVPHGEYLFRAMPRNAKYRAGKGQDVRTRPITTRSVLVMLKAYARKAGLDSDSIRPHAGRVFFITEAYRRTRDLERIARAVGHKAIATTRRYLRYLEEPKDHAALSVRLTPREVVLRPSAKSSEGHGR